MDLVATVSADEDSLCGHVRMCQHLIAEMELVRRNVVSGHVESLAGNSILEHILHREGKAAHVVDIASEEYRA